MYRWSFNLRVYFLKERLKDILSFQSSGKDIIQDRTIYEDAKIFAPNLFRQGNMNTRDFETYSDLFEQMQNLIKYPDLTIYLKTTVPTLVAQIQKRGREYENSMRIDYLQGLHELYEEWIENYGGRILVIDADICKFENNPSDFEDVVRQIDETISLLKDQH